MTPRTRRIIVIVALLAFIAVPVLSALASGH